MLSIFVQILVNLIKYLRIIGRKHGPSKYSNTRYIIPFISVYFNTIHQENHNGHLKHHITETPTFSADSFYLLDIKGNLNLNTHA